MKRFAFNLALAAALLLPGSVSAYNFQVDGIYYDIVDMNRSTCKVTRGDADYTGDVVIPEKVTYIGRELTVKEIESGAFYYNVDLQSVVIPNSVTWIGSSAFKGCKSLQSIEIPNGTISNRAFMDCENLKEVVIGDGVSEIYMRSFYNCRKMETLSLGNSVTRIGDHAFYGCDKLKTVVIPDCVTTLEDKAFNCCLGLESVVIGDGVTSIGYAAFAGCYGLQSVIIGENVKTIGASAFWVDYRLSSIVIPNSVTTIRNGAFQHSALKEITLGSNLSLIEEYAFDDTGLAVIRSFNTVPPTVEDNNFTAQQYADAAVYVPESALDAYRTAAVWKNFFSIQSLQSAGINNVAENAGVTVSAVDGSIVINGYDGAAIVEVFGIGGNRVYSGHDAAITDLAPGVYVVRIGNSTTKVML